MRATQLLVAAVLAASQASAKAVFAHFMIGNTGTYTLTDMVYDMQLAQQAAIDGFALNMAYGDEANDKSVSLAFQAAAQVSGFKVFFSFDYAGNGPWPKATVTEMIQTYGGQAEYFQHSTGQPLVSTFEGPDNAEDWVSIKADTGCYFVPSWSSLGARKALAKEDHVVDGLFNWAAWPEGDTRTNYEVDASYLIFLNNSGSYMAPVSPWFYTNMPGYDKNWLWGGDALWFDRWQQLINLAQIGNEEWPNQPEYIEIISWNDFGESHYIGPLNDKAYVAFDADKGNPPFNYALGMPHDGWRQFLPYLITMWKTGTAVVTEEALVSWYRLAPGRACDTGGTTGNTASQSQTETTPWSLATDTVYFAVLAGSSYTPLVTIGDYGHVVAWDSAPDASVGYVGIYTGHADWDGYTGDVKIELLTGAGAVVATLDGAAISPTCQNSVQNWNAWVGSTTGRSISASPSLNMADQVCLDGTGSSAEFVSLCEFSCKYGYCPPGPCTCFQMGGAADRPDAEDVNGYPLAGSECTFLGLCAFSCNYGFCPSEYCTTDAAAEGQCYVPVPDYDDDDGDGTGTSCTSGTGADNFAGLCSFSCGRGYCPIGPCVCTGLGDPITPPAATSDDGYPAAGLGSDYVGLCDFACSRGYCPEGACTYTDPYGGIYVPDPSCTGEEKEWNCDTIDCSVAGDGANSVTDRWNAVGTNEFFDYTSSWFGDYNDFNPNPATGAQPFDGTPWEDNPVNAIAYFFGGKNAQGGSKISSNLNCGTLSSANACSDPTAFLCGTTDIPALDLLLTSFSNIHNFYNTMYESLDSVESDLSLLIEDVASTFWEEEESGLEIFIDVIDAFSTILGVAASSFWVEVVNLGAFEGVSEGAEKAASAADTFSGGFQLLADAQAETAKTLIDVETSLKTAASEFFTQTRAVLDSWMKGKFYGSWSDYADLKSHIEDGLFLDDRSPSSFDWYTTMTPVVTGMSIIQAWRQAGDSSGLAVIYEEGDKTAPSYSLIQSEPDQEATRVKVPDGDYTLWIVLEHMCGGSGGDDCLGGASVPTGIDEIADENNSWGLTKDDIALSAFYGYMLGGMTNPYGIFNTKATGLDASKDSPLPYGAGVRTPGVFQIPVCTTTVYRDTLTNGRTCDTYPCCE